MSFRENCSSSSSALVIVFISFVVVTPLSSPVCQQLTHRIEQLLGNKNTHYYMKSITCIQAFREQSVKVNKHSLFSLQKMHDEMGVFSFKITLHSCGFAVRTMSQCKSKLGLFHFSQLEPRPVLMQLMCLCVCMQIRAFRRVINGV